MSLTFFDWAKGHYVMFLPVAWSANPSQSVDKVETCLLVAVGEEPCNHMLPGLGRVRPGVFIRVDIKPSNC